jgi:hypothetical protein
MHQDQTKESNEKADLNTGQEIKEAEGKIHEADFVIVGLSR